MQPAEGANRQRVSEHVTQQPIPPVLVGTKPVAVLDTGAPTGQIAKPRAELVVDSGVAAQNVASPTVVIPGNHDDGYASVRRVGKGGECTEPSARNDRFPFEPELEQITVDYDRSAALGDMANEGNHGTLDVCRCETEMRVGNDVARHSEHARILPMVESLYKHELPNDLRRVTNESPGAEVAPLYHDVEFRVRYAETDQMGVVYHTNYLVWCEVGRTDFIRARGMSYADMERAGIGLAVSELTARFHSAARYDDMIRVRTTLAEVRSRGITFDYVITKAETGHRLVTARTALVSIDASGRPTALPVAVRALFDRA